MSVRRMADYSVDNLDPSMVAHSVPLMADWMVGQREHWMAVLRDLPWGSWMAVWSEGCLAELMEWRWAEKMVE